MLEKLPQDHELERSGFDQRQHSMPQRPVWTRRIVLLALSCTFSLVLCEILARMMFPAPPYPYRQPRLAYVRDAQLTYFHKTNQTGWIDDGKASINSLGLRGMEPAIPKPTDLFRILILGDSITFGWGVDDADTFCAYLESALNGGEHVRRVEVVNGGVAGYTTSQERTLLSLLAPRLEPDLVLVGFYWNDLLLPKLAGDDRREQSEGRTEITNTGPHNRGEFHVSRPGHWWERILRRSRAAFVSGRAVKRLSGSGEWGKSHASLATDLLEGRQSEEIERRWTKFESELEGIAKLAKDLGFKAGIVVLPSRQQVSDEYPMARIQSRVREIADSLDMTFIDLLPPFRARGDNVESLFIPYDRHHPSASGHRLIADAISEELRSIQSMERDPL